MGGNCKKKKKYHAHIFAESTMHIFSRIVCVFLVPQQETTLNLGFIRSMRSTYLAKYEYFEHYNTICVFSQQKIYMVHVFSQAVFVCFSEGNFSCCDLCCMDTSKWPVYRVIPYLILCIKSMSYQFHGLSLPYPYCIWVSQVVM